MKHPNTMTHTFLSIRIGLAGLLFCTAITIGTYLAVAAESPGKADVKVSANI